MTEKTKHTYEKTAHLFAHRKSGVQKRFEKMYSEVKAKVQTAWTADLLKMEQEIAPLRKVNNALATTKLDRMKSMASTAAKEVMNTVFAEWRAEINRIVNDLGGYPQDDGNILFPDGSVARMPKGLWIAPEEQLHFN